MSKRVINKPVFAWAWQDKVTGSFAQTTNRATDRDMQIQLARTRRAAQEEGCNTETHRIVRVAICPINRYGKICVAKE